MYETGGCGIGGITIIQKRNSIGDNLKIRHFRLERSLHSTLELRSFSRAWVHFVLYPVDAF